MKFSDWEPAYAEILADFGFPREQDERARDALADLAKPFDNSRFDALAGATVAIAGAGPSLESELDRAKDADAVFSASVATDVLLDAEIDVDCMVTDLDKNPATARELSEQGVPVAVHAHGDNIPPVRKLVPTFDVNHVLATTQVEPRGPVENFGGFTDGDRAAFLADHFRADELVFLGWDFDDPDVNAMKRQKLRWAERLVYWLEGRRDERFSILDGRRENIDAGWILR